MQKYRNWWLNNGNPVIREYKLTFPFTVDGHIFAGQTGCESNPTRWTGDDIPKSKRIKDLAATVPTDGNAQTMDCAVCGEKHGDPIEYGGMKLYACPKVPDDGTIINMTAIIEKYGKR